MTDPTDPEMLPGGASPSTPSGDCFGLLGARLDGKYDVEAIVAEGGFGVVYRATHRTLQKTVAVKVLKVPLELSGMNRAEFLAKFALEARLIAHLDHPAIVRVIDFGASPMPRGEAAPWMVLEWLPGATLEGELASGTLATPMSARDAFALLRPIFEALSYAHEEGVAHRDMKPANMMRTRTRRGETTLRLMDFGIAKTMGNEERSTTGSTATTTALAAFSLHYAAPEQLSGTRTGPWTDVHAMGLILTELLTGRAPYEGTEAHELYAQVLSPQRPTPARVGIDVGAWEPVLARALALRPADRWANAHALTEALSEALSATTSVAPERVLTDAKRSPRASPTTLRASAVQTTPRVHPSRRSNAALLALAIGVAGVGGGWLLETLGTSPTAHTPAMKATEPTNRPSIPSSEPSLVELPTAAPPQSAAPSEIQLVDGGTPPRVARLSASVLPHLNQRRALPIRPPQVPPGASSTAPAPSDNQARPTGSRPTANEQLPAE